MDVVSVVQVRVVQPISILTTVMSLFVLMLLPAPAWAIPSPDLVVNMFGSVAQLLGLSTVLLGAGFMNRRSISKRSGSHRGWRRLFWGAFALLFISLVGNLLQYSHNLDATNQRLQANLWRSSSESGKKVGDTSLKTLQFSDQIQHPRGIRTETLDQWLSEGRDINLIDVRESEEFEMGSIAGATHSRYPDTRINIEKLIDPEKENVLMCFSGNRSSELCSEFTEKGLSCRFVVGGFEKWMAEGRAMAGTENSAEGTLRDLPDYPNREVLLETSDVNHMVMNDNAVFIDVRYPGDYEKGHLPGAINLPVRKMTTSELDAALSNLPKQPLISACYDKRSCFYSKIAGLKLYRAGYDYRGRYTTPHEYMLPRKEKAYVAQWQKMRSQTLFDLVIQPLEKSLIWLHKEFSSLATAIVLLVIMLRLIVMPLSLKAERDSAIQRQLKPEVDALKAKCGANKKRFSSAVMKLHKFHGLTPGRNLFASLFQLTLFMAFFSAVNAVSKGVDESLLWLPSLGMPDPFYLLPVLVGVLMLAQIVGSTTRRTHGFLALYVALSAGISALCLHLNSAVNVYLVLSLAFVVIQTRVVSRVETQKAKRIKQQEISKNAAIHCETGIARLDEAHRVKDTGNKAARLGQMKAAGLPVPDGFVLTDVFLSRAHQGRDGLLEYCDSDAGLLKQAFVRLEVEKVAVRSTGLAEDGANQSFAGVFDSVLNVTEDNLVKAVTQVRQSYQNGRVASYSVEKDHDKGSVLIQAMVDADYAGVMFTEHPDSTGCMLVEVVEGLGESLVSGTATPTAYRYGVVSGVALDETDQAPINLKPLILLGQKIEEVFGSPQDIEWAYANGHFYILQARDITVFAQQAGTPKAILEQERHRLLSHLNGENNDDDAVLQQNELAELLPAPTPMSFSVMERLWEIGGTTDIACQQLGMPYHVDEDSKSYLTTVFGNLYVNNKEGKRRFGSPGSLASFQLSRQAHAIELGFREEFVPALVKDMRMREALDLSRFDGDELFGLLEEWSQRFIEEDYVQAEVINIAADFYLKSAERDLKKFNLDPAKYLGHGPETVMHHVMGMLPGIKSGDRTVKDFTDVFGFRAVHDYELAEPRYMEERVLVEQMVASASSERSTQAEMTALPDKRLLKLSVERARVFQSLKEDAKHYCMRSFATLRNVILEIDRRFDLNGGIFFLALDEVLHIRGKFDEQVRKLILERQEAHRLFKSITLPTKLSIHDLERLQFDQSGNLVNTMSKGGALQGNKVSGSHEVTGSVRIVDENTPANCISKGDILVARYTDPRWIPFFEEAGGIVTEVGGWLSHMTIVAREYNLPCVVGASGALAQLVDGQMVKVCESGLIDRRLRNDQRLQSHAKQIVNNLPEERRVSDRRLFQDAKVA